MDAFYAVATERLDSFLDPAVLESAETEIEANRDRVHQIGRFARTGTLFDAGSGPGFFMKAAERAGWRVLGCDPVPAAVEFGRNRLGLRSLQQGTFASVVANLPPSLDVVTLFHTLEHMVDPQAELMNAASILRPGGIVSVEVPNMLSPEAGAAGPAWAHLRLPFHLYFFTPLALEEAFARCGLRLLEMGPRDVPPLSAWFLRAFASRPWHP